MKKGFSIFLFLLTAFTVFAGIGNLVIRAFYGYRPEAWFILMISAISGLLTWAGIHFWRK